jgi:hypothetical protein
MKSIKKSNSGVVNKVTCLMSKIAAPDVYQRNEKPIKNTNCIKLVAIAIFAIIASFFLLISKLIK